MNHRMLKHAFYPQINLEAAEGLSALVRPKKGELAGTVAATGSCTCAASQALTGEPLQPHPCQCPPTLRRGAPALGIAGAGLCASSPKPN